ncbi:cytosolic protein [Alkalibacillus aidingensis]|uniref:cytosolic protein n=1 Tax=Alkalibacillus aidingensis TaxID=2747607 RepID=UPI001660CD2A|nr:cytosolic protein [Alkalibacillus aidingensis]
MAKRKKNDDFADVEVQQNYQIPQEFPEGTYGTPINQDEPLQARDDDPKRRHQSAFNYENKQLHEDMPRQYPTSHEPEDFPHHEGLEDEEKE